MEEHKSYEKCVLLEFITFFPSKNAHQNLLLLLATQNLKRIFVYLYTLTSLAV